VDCKATPPTQHIATGLVDPAGYIPPNQQDMLLLDITSGVLHSEDITNLVGKGVEYLRPTAPLQRTWPASGHIYGYN